MDGRTHPTIDVVMLGSFGVWTRGTIQSRALPLARALCGQAGLRVAIVTTPWDAPAQAGVREDIDGVHIFNTRSHDMRNALRVVKEQVQLVHSLQPSILHVLKPKASAGLAADILTPLNPRLSLIVDYDDWEGDGGWNDHGSYPAPLRRLFSHQETRLLRRAHGVTAASTLLEERALRQRDDEMDRSVFYLPNGLVQDWRRTLYSAARRCRDQSTARLVLYSRFAEFSTSWMIDVIQSIDRKLDRSVPLDIVGNADFGAGDLPRLTRIEPVFHGFVDRDALPELLGRATIALYPYDDNLINRSKQSVKLIELMASGCALVGSRVGETQRVAGDAVVAVDPGNVEAFAEAVVELILNSRKSAELGIAARRRAEMFDMEILAERLHKIYQQFGFQ